MVPQATASLPTTLRSPPALDSYTPLADHESRTPASFYEGPPVLHYHTTGARAYVSRENRDKLPWGGNETRAAAASDESWPVMGDGMVEQVVDVFVGSDSAASCGLSLPYPVIGLHAIKSAYTADNRRVPTIYMQLELSGTGGEEDEPETVELTVVPAGAQAAATTATSSFSTDQPSAGDAERQEAPRSPQADSEASKMFDAISACADLHPDRFGGEDGEDDGGDSYPSFFRQGGENGDGEDGYEDEYDEDGDGEGDDGILIEGGDGMEPIEGFHGVFRGGNSQDGAVSTISDLPPPMPGSGGWITAENAHEFFDEEGNWRGRGGSLGEGAGRVRGRDEVEAGEATETTATEEVAGGAIESTPAEGALGDGGSASVGDTNEASNGDGTESKRIRTE
ncbi:hypothetical protein HMPREF1624_00056 [Sporothrix schenckii ATCC 58251]|uniref:Uncharacterized protein n=1 Tax=Sporothrix schenckii (strain ATCC 58251 / de Perez 2211183) TaxID=1391915 RepID=U7Q3I5_SPOS1|nr:hypothetical protein HMPREF1624_00056 [Sporothrix schenckii ATCC 58251]